MSKNHNALSYGEFGVPTLFDFFSRPLSAFSGFDMENGGFKADVVDKGDRYQVKAEMPGVKKEDIKLSFDDGVLTIKAEHNTEKKEGSEKKGYRASGLMTQILRTSMQPTLTASWTSA